MQIPINPSEKHRKMPSLWPKNRDFPGCFVYHNDNRCPPGQAGKFLIMRALFPVSPREAGDGNGDFGGGGGGIFSFLFAKPSPFHEFEG